MILEINLSRAETFDNSFGNESNFIEIKMYLQLVIVLFEFARGSYTYLSVLSFTKFLYHNQGFVVNI